MYTSSLQLTYLKKRDEGNITCNVMILETTGSDSVEIVNITGKYLYGLMLMQLKIAGLLQVAF